MCCHNSQLVIIVNLQILLVEDSIQITVRLKGQMNRLSGTGMFPSQYILVGQKGHDPHQFIRASAAVGRQVEQDSINFRILSCFSKTRDSDAKSILRNRTAIFIIVFPAVIYSRSGKINSAAVLTGAAGYLLLYISLITLSAGRGMTLPVIMYALAIILFVMLCGIGIKADLKNPKVHWVIEISNVVCQFLVAAATVMLFS